MGKWSNMYLFFRMKHNWTITEYTRYTTTLGMVGVGAQFLVMPFLTSSWGLQLRDTTILLVSTVKLRIQDASCIIWVFFFCFLLSL